MFDIRHVGMTSLQQLNLDTNYMGYLSLIKKELVSECGIIFHKIPDSMYPLNCKISQSCLQSQENTGFLSMGIRHLQLWDWGRGSEAKSSAKIAANANKVLLSMPLLNIVLAANLLLLAFYKTPRLPLNAHLLLTLYAHVTGFIQNFGTFLQAKKTEYLSKCNHPKNNGLHLNTV